MRVKSDLKTETTSFKIKLRLNKLKSKLEIKLDLETRKQELAR